jgi:hypothetical protein
MATCIILRLGVEFTINRVNFLLYCSIFACCQFPMWHKSLDAYKSCFQVVDILKTWKLWVPNYLEKLALCLILLLRSTIWGIKKVDNKQSCIAKWRWNSSCIKRSCGKSYQISNLKKLFLKEAFLSNIYYSKRKFTDITIALEQC